MSYQKQSFDKCFFNPLEKDLLKTYPQLKELIDGIEISDRQIKYCLSMYDPKSPVVKDNPDINARKIAAAEVAGYDKQKDKEELDKLFACDEEGVIVFTINFLRKVVKSRVWASLCADEQVFWEFIQRLFKPISEDSDKTDVDAQEKKLKISKGKEEVSALIEVNWNKLLGDDEDLKKKVKKQDYSPESMAGI